MNLQPSVTAVLQLRTKKNIGTRCIDVFVPQTLEIITGKTKKIGI